MEWVATQLLQDELFWYVILELNTACWSTIFMFLHSAVQCFELKDPMHGQVELKERTFHSKARYVCNNGFYLVGDEYRMCQSSGSWSGNAAYCECESL